ncbi:hypothetical protein ASPBRDRAFT_36528 [Aspergillus brasiliensis CBS 101740]|uniref:Uncharacterized protein n=1 Tax=Aspergillus brasiliensis (strain CBS 101740 / IMI 381727 / IBT 21946) TaxID=767769 RepID=A0A1L9V0J3_ASPBC|nr:hypothetical protein ASPBRDRAFT_36528 [Aspergillus brasiliensis CBS 101740]
MRDKQNKQSMGYSAREGQRGERERDQERDQERNQERDQERKRESARYSLLEQGEKDQGKTKRERDTIC